MSLVRLSTKIIVNPDFSRLCVKKPIKVMVRLLELVNLYRTMVVDFGRRTMPTLDGGVGCDTGEHKPALL